MLNTGDNTLVYQDQVISLTKMNTISYSPNEKQGKVVSREKLMEQLWETDSFVDDNTLTVNITRLRKKLESRGLDTVCHHKIPYRMLDQLINRKRIFMRFFFFYFKQRRAEPAFLSYSPLFLSVFFALYHLPVEAVLYPAGICATLGAGYLLFDFQKAFRKLTKSFKLQEMTAAVMEDFPEAVTQDDIDYQQLIQQLREEQRQLENQMSIRYADMVEYYTIWAHQIKTPIASMRLHLQNEDSSFPEGYPTIYFALSSMWNGTDVSSSGLSKHRLCNSRV